MSYCGTTCARAPVMTRTILGTVLAASALACSSSPPGQQDSDIIAGVRHFGDPAVVAITRDDRPHCTGTIIAPTLLLTAAHCVDDWSLDQLRALFASSVWDPEPGAASIPFVDAWVPAEYADNQDYDIAVLVLAEATDVTPAPLLRKALPSNVVGGSLRVVGYGQTAPEDKVAGVKYQAFANILEATDTHLVHDPNTCPGDSGGPGFLRVGGQELLVGVHSKGSCGLGAPSRKVRVDRHLDFITTGMPGTPPVDVPPHEDPPKAEYPSAVHAKLTIAAGKKLRGAIRCEPGTDTLALELTGGTGKAHAYLRLGELPSTTQFDVDLDGPPSGLVLDTEDFLPGLWNILVHAETKLSNVQLNVECL